MARRALAAAAIGGVYVTVMAPRSGATFAEIAAPATRRFINGWPLTYGCSGYARLAIG